MIQAALCALVGDCQPFICRTWTSISVLETVLAHFRKCLVARERPSETSVTASEVVIYMIRAARPYLCMRPLAVGGRLRVLLSFYSACQYKLVSFGLIPIVVAIRVSVRVPVTPSIVVIMMVTWTVSDVKTNLDVVPIFSIFSMLFCQSTTWS